MGKGKSKREAETQKNAVFVETVQQHYSQNPGTTAGVIDWNQIRKGRKCLDEEFGALLLKIWGPLKMCEYKSLTMLATSEMCLGGRMSGLV